MALKCFSICPRSYEIKWNYLVKKKIWCHLKKVSWLDNNSLHLTIGSLFCCTILFHIYNWKVGKQYCNWGNTFNKGFINFMILHLDRGKCRLKIIVKLTYPSKFFNCVFSHLLKSVVLPILYLIKFIVNKIEHITLKPRTSSKIAVRVIMQDLVAKDGAQWTLIFRWS